MRHFTVSKLIWAKTDSKERISEILPAWIRGENRFGSIFGRDSLQNRHVRI